MKTYRHLYPQVIAWENLELAYHSARKGKRTHAPVAAFEFDRERNLTELQEELREKAYRPGPYHSFIIHEPKRRLISAAPFRDRVVHHALCNVIEPIFEPRFVFDSYANRVGKGTHRALDRCTYNSNHNIGLRVVGSHGLWVRPEMPRGCWLLRDRGKGRELGLPEERRGLLLAGGSLIPSPGEYGIALPLVVGGIICNRSPGQGNVTHRSPKLVWASVACPKLEMPIVVARLPAGVDEAVPARHSDWAQDRSEQVQDEHIGVKEVVIHLACPRQSDPRALCGALMGFERMQQPGFLQQAPVL